MLEYFRSLFESGPLKGVPVLPVLVDLRYMRERFGASVELLEELPGVNTANAARIERYLTERTKQGARLIALPVEADVRRGSAAGWKYYLEISSELIMPLEPFPGRLLAYTATLERASESRAAYEAEIGRAARLEVAAKLKFKVTDEQYPLRTPCHVCQGRASVACRRCGGKGRYVSRKGQSHPCGDAQCRGGQVTCPFCKGEGRISCGVSRDDGRLRVRFPRDIEDGDRRKLFLESLDIRPGEHLLFSKAQQAFQTGASRSPLPDYLGQAAREFHAGLAEMEEFLDVQLQVGLMELESMAVGAGYVAEEAEGRLVMKFAARGEAPPGWRSGEALYLVSGEETARLPVTLTAVKAGSVAVAACERDLGGQTVPGKGLLIKRGSLKTIDVQRRALVFWQQADIVSRPLKRVLAQPSAAPAARPAPLKKLFNEQIAENPAQLTALERALSREAPLICVQGPPGSGKTALICELIRQELETRESKILLSSQSNLAVDNVLERLSELGVQGLLRLGAPDRVAEPVQRYLPTNVLASIRQKSVISWIAQALRRIVFGHGAEEQSDRDALKSYARVVGATCIGAGDPMLFSLSRPGLKQAERISLVIVDEAGRSTPSETLVPLQHAERAVLVGDHKQLPPLIQPDARQLWAERHQGERLECSRAAVSLLEQLARALPPPDLIVLNTQFRMHPEIGSFISEVFYADERLENGVSAHERELPISGFPEALSYHSTRAYGSRRFDRRPQGSSSRINDAEVELTARLVKFLDSAVLDAASLGVITFYAAQAEELRRALSAAAMRRLVFNPSQDVATLDSYQGREKDIIILSLVRSPENPLQVDPSWLKFFLDLRRLNVALSRARRRLLIVGDIERLLQIDYSADDSGGFLMLERLWDYIERHNLAV